MKSKIMAAAVAGGLLVAAGFVTSLVSAPSVASAQEDDPADASTKGVVHRGVDFLSEVLSDLVGNGTINQDQADAITSAVRTKIEDGKAQREANRELIQGFLEDGVITSDEMAQLPDDHPFNDPNGPFAEAAADGQLTAAEIREAMPHPRRNAFRRGARFGALLDDGGIDATEYAGLPADSPLKQIDVSPYLDDDGVITIDELRQIRNDWRALQSSDSSGA
ncbi:MAG: hypothetical protein WBZ40_03630 [Acidimicrobiia bacterium]